MVLLFLHKSKKYSLKPVSRNKKKLKKREENSPKRSFHRTIVRSHDSRHSNGPSLQSSKERGIIGESYYQTDWEFRNTGILHNSGFRICSDQPFYLNSTALNVSVSWFRKKINIFEIVPSNAHMRVLWRLLATYLKIKPCLFTFPFYTTLRVLQLYIVNKMNITIWSIMRYILMVCSI